ncbi:MAG: dockerin type I domain-containing protein [Phycisphaerales bacterium]
MKISSNNAADISGALLRGAKGGDAALAASIAPDAVKATSARTDDVQLSEQSRAEAAKAAEAAKQAVALKQAVADKNSLVNTATDSAPSARAAVAAQDALARSADSAEPAQDAAAASAAPPPELNVTQDDLNGLLAAYGAVNGDARFDARFDYNNDGRIDFNDLNTALSSFSKTPSQPVPQTYTLDDVTSILSTYGRRAGEQGFDARFDTNNDGVVDFTDLNHVLSNISSPITQSQQQQLEGVIEGYGAGVGDPRYNAAYDVDNDGRISFRDLNAVLSSFNAPAQPEAPASPEAAVPPETPATPQTFSLNDVASVLSAYGRREGEQGYDARFDTNSNGVVDFTDLNHVLSNLTSPISSNHQQQLEGLIQGYGAGVGDPLFNAAFDFDNDGRISFADLNELLSQIAGPNPA